MPFTAPTLLGSIATLTVEYPDIGYVVTVPYEAIVSGATEFLSGVIQIADTFQNNILLSNTDVGEQSIDIEWVTFGQTASSAFNGLVYTFEHAPRIVNATVDPTQSTLTSNQARITFDDSTVYVNVENIRIPAGSRLRIAVTLMARQ